MLLAFLLPLVAFLTPVAVGVRVGDDDHRVSASKTRAKNDDEELYTPAFITPLFRPSDVPFHSLSDGMGDVVEETASEHGQFQELYAPVSRAQLLALQNARDESHPKQRHKKNKEKAEIASTLLTNLDSTEYVGRIGIGTIHHPHGCNEDDDDNCELREQSKLNVVFDTGSTNLWMASTLCVKGPCTQRDRKRYDMDKSETYDEPEDRRNLTITFATATLIGPTGVDQFHIGPFTVKNQTFGLIQEEKGPTFTELPLEGIVGLAFPSMARGGTAFFDNVINQKVLRKNMFSFYLSPTHRHSDSSLLQGLDRRRDQEYRAGMDAVLWGGIDKRLYEGELMWFPVTTAHYWSIDLFAFRIGNESMDLSEGRGDDSLSEADDDASTKARANLIVDSGTAYYTAEKHLYKKLMDRMSCNGRNPDLSYKLKDIDGNYVNLVITPEDYMVAHCEPGYVKIPVPERYGPALLLGELFMRKYFTVFDRGDGTDGDARVGLAKSRPGADVSDKGLQRMSEKHEKKHRSEDGRRRSNDERKSGHGGKGKDKSDYS